MLALCSFLLAGCAPFRAYTGPKAPRSDVAIIEVNHPVDQVMSGSEETVYLRKVNGFITAKDRVAVLPGPCEIEVGYRSGDDDERRAISQRNVRIEFKAEAGVAYAVYARRLWSKGHWYAVVWGSGREIARSENGVIVIKGPPQKLSLIHISEPTRPY